MPFRPWLAIVATSPGGLELFCTRTNEHDRNRQPSGHRVGHAPEVLAAQRPAVMLGHDDRLSPQVLPHGGLLRNDLGDRRGYAATAVQRARLGTACTGTS